MCTKRNVFLANPNSKKYQFIAHITLILKWNLSFKQRFARGIKNCFWEIGKWEINACFGISYMLSWHLNPKKLHCKCLWLHQMTAFSLVLWRSESNMEPWWLPESSSVYTFLLSSTEMEKEQKANRKNNSEQQICIYKKWIASLQAVESTEICGILQPERPVIPVFLLLPFQEHQQRASLDWNCGFLSRMCVHAYVNTYREGI